MAVTRGGWSEPRGARLLQDDEVWADELQLTTGQHDTVALIASTDRGQLVASVLTAEDQWGASFRVPGHTTRASSTAVLPDGRLLAAWIAPSEGQPSEKVMAAVSSVAGVEWGTPIFLSNLVGVVIDLKVAVTAIGRVAAVWAIKMELTDSGSKSDHYALQSSTLEVGASRWSTPVDISARSDEFVGAHRLIAGNSDFALSWGGHHDGNVSTLASGSDMWTRDLISQSGNSQVSIAAGPTRRLIALWDDSDSSQMQRIFPSTLKWSSLGPDGRRWEPAARSRPASYVGEHTPLTVTPLGDIVRLEQSPYGVHALVLEAGSSEWQSSVRLTKSDPRQICIAASPTGAVAVAWQERGEVWAATYSWATEWTTPVHLATGRVVDLIATASGRFVLGWIESDQAYVSIRDQSLVSAAQSQC